MKINEQGQKVYEVLSEEYIRLKECELELIENEINLIHNSGGTAGILLGKYNELSSHIEDLKAEL